MNEIEQLIMEATTAVEKELSIEDRGWLNLSAGQQVISPYDRINYIKQARIYYNMDPLAHRAVSLWTDYSFGTGMTWSCDDDGARKVLEQFWGSRDNSPILGAKGQRKSSDKLLIDGEVFFAIFLGAGQSTIRHIDPLEITEIVTDEDDRERPMYYKRNWSTPQGQPREEYYRSFVNLKGEPATDSMGKLITQKEGAVVYHLNYNSTEQRGNSLLLPALDWLKQYRRFLASRVAIVLAMAKFAWKVKAIGGPSSIAAVKSVYQDAAPQSGSISIENANADLQPIKTDTGARNAYDDGRMLKLQICAAVGIPEQYFGDISIGNLATAKTVELPMVKQFQSYQQVWADAYKDIDELILQHNGIPQSHWYVDRDFPPIAPADALAVAQAISQITMAFPDFVDSPDVKQQALIALGINDPGEVLDAMSKESVSEISARLAKALRDFKEVVNVRDLPDMRRQGSN